MIARRVALTALLALLPGAGRAAPEAAPVLRLELTFHRAEKGHGRVAEDVNRVELAGSRATLREDVLLSLSLDVAPELRPVPASIQARYAWARELTHDTADAGVRIREEKGVESGTRLLDWDVRLQRSFRPLACENAWVYDREEAERLQDDRSKVVLSSLPPGERAVAEAARHARARAREEVRRAAFSGLRVRLRATWPGRITLDDRLSGVPPFEQELVPLIDPEWTLPYDLEGPALRRATVARRGPAMGVTPPVEVVEDVEVSLKPIAPHEHGFAASALPDGALLAQNRIVAGGRDLSSAVRVVRFLRTWEVRDRPGRAEAHALARGWSELDGSSDRPASRRIVADAVLPPADVRTPGARRWLVEFLEMAEGLPELGLAYRQMAVEALPDGGYRVSAGEARTVSPATWCEIRRLATPATELPAVAKDGALRVLAVATQAPAAAR
jgi:hypothetical protein